MTTSPQAERPTIVPPEPTEREVRETMARRQAELDAAAERERQAVANRAAEARASAERAQARIARLAAAAAAELDASERAADRWTDVHQMRREEVFPRDFRLDLEAEGYNHLAAWTLDKLEDPRVKAIVERFVAGNGTIRKNLILTGGTGVGKTTTGVIAGHAFLREHGRHTRLITHREYIASQRKDAVNRDDVPAWKFAKRIKNVPVLVLDDFGADYEVGKPVWDTVRELTRALLDARAEADRVTIVTMNLTSDQLRVMFDDRIVSRLADGNESVVVRMVAATCGRRCPGEVKKR